MSWRVFYSYSHRDSELRNDLSTYLAPLKHQKKILEWHDRKISPGSDWDSEINSQLDTADLILFLISADFLASDYCFGVEVEKAFLRLKKGYVKLVPILLRDCLWEESRFRELQILPRDAKPITSHPMTATAFKEVAAEINKIVSEPVPQPASLTSTQSQSAISIDLVRNQLRNYALLYERTRQRMPSSPERTSRMSQIFDKMRKLAPVSYPLLEELIASPSPGERLAAVSILQIFASGQYLDFLEEVVRAEKPFVVYQAAKALQFAAGSIEPQAYPKLLKTVLNAQASLASSGLWNVSDRMAVLKAAESEVRETMKALELNSSSD